MKPSQLLDLARTAARLPSDYSVAQRLGVTTAVVSNWRHDRKYPGQLELFRLAELAGRNPAEVIAAVELQRAETAGRIDQADTWRGVISRLAGASAAAAVVLMTSAPPPAAAAGNAAQSGSQPLYIMSSSRRRLRELLGLAKDPALNPA